MIIALHIIRAMRYHNTFQCEGWYMKATLKKAAAGFGYGFLVGAAVGLVIGVITGNLFFWIVVCSIAGFCLGWIVSLIISR